MTSTDWHNADIIASVRKKTGLSLRRLSLQTGLNEQACKQCLQRPYEKAEIAISNAIGIPAYEIWPSRYEKDGTRKRLLHSKRLSNKSLKATFKHQKAKK